jgi:LuxR family maltose regulon positive regulatory protein
VLDERHPPNLRLVLITRADPALRLHRLRVGGGLTEIRAQDLQFTQREAAQQLFQLNDLALSDDQLRALLDRTQGWPVGLRLAAMSLSSTEDIAEGIARFTGTHQSVAEYLIVEVLDRLPPANREFMLKTSIAERLSAPLATALTGRSDSQSTMGLAAPWAARRGSSRGHRRGRRARRPQDMSHRWSPAVR